MLSSKKSQLFITGTNLKTEYAPISTTTKVLLKPPTTLSFFPSILASKPVIIPAVISAGAVSISSASRLKPISKPIVEPISSPITKPISKPITKTTTKPITRTITKPVTKPVTTPPTVPMIELPSPIATTPSILRRPFEKQISKIKGFKVSQPKKYTPTARAMSFQLKGKTSKIGIASGLGERFITPKFTMPKTKKKKLKGVKL